MKRKIFIFASIITLLACESIVVEAKPYYKEAQESRNLEHYKWSHNFYCSVGAISNLLFATSDEVLVPGTFGASIAVGFKGRYDHFELEGRFAQNIENMEGPFYGNINSRSMFDCPIGSRCFICSGLLIGINFYQAKSVWGINVGIPLQFGVHLTDRMALNINADYIFVNLSSHQISLGTSLIVKI